VRDGFGGYHRARQLAEWSVGAPLADVMREVERILQTGRRPRR
jgi:hypothetical protein